MWGRSKHVVYCWWNCKLDARKSAKRSEAKKNPKNRGICIDTVPRIFCSLLPDVFGPMLPAPCNFDSFSPPSKTPCRVSYFTPKLPWTFSFWYEWPQNKLVDVFYFFVFRLLWLILQQEHKICLESLQGYAVVVPWCSHPNAITLGHDHSPKPLISMFVNSMAWD